jgi:hypothetical protein
MMEETSMSRPAAVLRRIASVEAAAARLALWAEALAADSAIEAARLLDEAVRRAALREPAAVAAFLPLLDAPELLARVGPGRLAELLDAARGEDRPGCLLLLEHPGPPVAADRLGPPPDPLLETLSLGHRRAAARGRRSGLLDRILRDPDPRVVAEVLRNPRLREAEVLAIASRRPCPEEVFWLLLRTGGWLRRPALQRAVVLNPYAPPRLASGLAVLLTGPDLDAVANAEGLHPAVRDGALLVLGWRRAAGEG